MPNKVIIILLLFFVFVFVLRWDGAVNAVFFYGCRFFLLELFFYSIFIYLFKSRRREVTSQKMTTKFSNSKLNKSHSVSCAPCAPFVSKVICLNPFVHSCVLLSLACNMMNIKSFFINKECIFFQRLVGTAEH